MLNQPLSKTNAVQTPVAGASMRELSLDELQQVSGGLPNGTWTVPPVANNTAGGGSPVDLPNGTW